MNQYSIFTTYYNLVKLKRTGSNSTKNVLVVPKIILEGLKIWKSSRKLASKLSLK
ncbi:20217_t:CDS:1, partial [Funneliformis geosporum]